MELGLREGAVEEEEEEEEGDEDPEVGMPSSSGHSGSPPSLSSSRKAREGACLGPNGKPPRSSGQMPPECGTRPVTREALSGRSAEWPGC